MIGERSNFFGNLDALKHGVVKQINQAPRCNPFLENIIGGSVAAARRKLWSDYVLSQQKEMDIYGERYRM